MKSALLALTFFLGVFAPQVLATEPVEHDAQCVAIYINGVGVPSDGTYPTTIKSGETFHVEIKMKNLGTKSWVKLQNYKLGKSGDTTADADELQWGLNRVEIPNSNSVNTGSEVVFAFDAVNRHQASNKALFKWGMLRERSETNSEEGGNQVIDPGGRFGQICSINLSVEGTNVTTPTVSVTQPQVQPKAPEAPKAPEIKTSTMCTDPQKGVREISASWNGYVAPSVKVYLKDTGSSKDLTSGKLVDQSPCLGSGTQNYTFAKMTATDNIFKVAVVPYTDSSCGRADLNAPAGGYYGNVNNGGFGYPNMSTDPTAFGIKTIYFDFGDKRPYYTCTPLAFTLSIPAGKTTLQSFDTPINILLTRYAPSVNGVVQRNDVNTSHPFIIRYRPSTQTEDGGTQKVPAPAKTNTSDPNNATGNIQSEGGGEQ